MRSVEAFFFGLIVMALCCWSYANDERRWVVGFQKVDGVCKPVGGLAQPGRLPFRYSSMDDCLENKVAQTFDKAAKRWEGFVLDDGQCLKVWARSLLNPFNLVKLPDCEKERISMKTALATLEGAVTLKRSTDEEEALKVARFALDLTIHMLAITVNPAFVLLKPFVAFLWPSPKKPSAWDQVRAKVHKLINQKMNEAYANDLKNFLTSLKKEMDAYNGYSDTSSQKVPKIISIDTSLGVREEKFMNKKDPVSTLTYYVPYVTTRLMVKLEAMKVAKPAEKQPHAKEFLALCKRHIPFLGKMAYGEFEKWRLGQLSCKKTRKYAWRTVYYLFEWKDEVTGTYKQARKNTRQGNELAGWCKAYKDSVQKQVDEYVLTLRDTVKSWATMFNNLARNPFVKGFTATDSKITTDGKLCKLPFTYSGKSYSKCTSVDHTQPWCIVQGDSWGNCYSAEKLDIDLTSCKMSTNLNEQYFGHKSVAENGKPCLSWEQQTKYKDFPMDGQSRSVASTHCRRLLKTDYRPWCYTTASWSYCSIRDCDETDWA